MGHSPGAWQADSEGSMGFSIRSDTGVKWSQIAEVRPNKEGSRAVSPAECYANAYLIAAAPKLLASCKEMVAGLLATASLGLNEDEVVRLQRAEAAIAKAEGRS